jgi:hypothetical protein
MTHTLLLYCTIFIHSYFIVHDSNTVLYCKRSIHSYFIVHDPYTCTATLLQSSKLGFGIYRTEFMNNQFFLKIVLQNSSKSTGPKWFLQDMGCRSCVNFEDCYCTWSIHCYFSEHDQYTATLVNMIHTPLLYCAWFIHCYFIVHDSYTALYCTWSLHCYFSEHDPYTATLLCMIHTLLLYCTWFIHRTLL